MRISNWKALAKHSADPGRAQSGFERLAEANPDIRPATMNPEAGRIIAAVFSGSEALGNLLATHAEWLEAIAPERVKFPRRRQGIETEVGSWLPELLRAADYPGALSRLRVLRQREMLRIAARDLARLGQLEEILQEISDLADVCLNSTWQVCWHQLTARHGRPYHLDPQGRWRPTEACVLGMGKLGGQELNYSSDVDVLFVYAEEGGLFKEAPGRSKKVRPSMTNHQFFNRLAEAFIAEVTRMAPEGTLYRIDLRLRPEGDTGPLSRSLPSYENYYAQWGQTWERMMLIKARSVAGDSSLAAEFLETVQPFRYPRSVNAGVLREVAAMKDRIENEVVKAGELDSNVKLGRGGIREIEFIVQSLQLLHAGRQPFLQGARTLPCLAKLVQYELIGQQEATTLRGAYEFLRDVEHRLQMEGNRQTHTIPNDRVQQERLARLMGFPGLEAFTVALRKHTSAVRGIFERLLKPEEPETAAGSPFPSTFAGTEPQWTNLLAQHGFRDPANALRVLREFVEGPGYIHVSARTSELAFQLLPRFFALCRKPGAQGSAPAALPGSVRAPLSDPDRVVTRLDSFIAAYGARSTLFELWHSNPSIFELLLLLFDRSEFLAELAIRTPDLVDELVTSGRLRQRKTAEETLRDLRHGREDADQHLWLRRYHQAELMRIGLRDILGLADEEQYLTELSALADACLQYALEVVMRGHKLTAPPFAIMGLGKLGGAEIDYGSDLDIVFIADSKARDLAKLGRYATELMDLVSRRTEQGILFETDARLRPDGEKGLLVNTLKNFEEYYRSRAQLWEIQSLTRTRTVAGDPGIGAGFQTLAKLLTDFAHPTQPLSAYQPQWKQTIHQMRLRIEKERTPKGQDALAIKTGAGGLMDAEFVAQTLSLEHGWQEPNTLKGLERGYREGHLKSGEGLIRSYRSLRRLEGILRRWSYEGETVLPEDPAPFLRVAIRCGFGSAEQFREAVAAWRADLRKAYLEVLSP